MIEIDIPSIDPIQHKPKVFFGMTSRQIICIIPGVGLGAILFAACYSWSLDIALIALGISVVPAVCLGWLTPYNMVFEDYVKLVYFNTFVSNPKRIYKTDNEEDVKLMTIKERQAKEKAQQEAALAEKKKKKNASKEAQ